MLKINMNEEPIDISTPSLLLLFNLLSFVPTLFVVIVQFSELPSSHSLQSKAAAFKIVEVIGVIRGSENPSIFVPANDPSSSQWFYVDVPAIASASGVPENTIYIEDINENINPSNPYPVPKDVNTLIRSSVMPQDHLNYTLTWYVCFPFLNENFYCDLSV